MRQYREDKKSDGLTLILDGINDPGNLGTIIRIADWYGVSRIIASIDTVDCYNPKVIMATMGSFTRVRLEYRDLQEYLSQLKSKKIY
jgi:RNA methyltransferase, TrmH family